MWDYYGRSRVRQHGSSGMGRGIGRGRLREKGMQNLSNYIDCRKNTVAEWVEL